ncbi:MULTISPECIES: hypothetical protein [Micromonospora]|uniref:hypothetical protein n=1 Tax=unclassified Micromonospora TaxID=2617518 RepID=UPI001E3145A8|nr:hypothetical protein [Micromonospora sp. NBRC 110038]
MRSYYVYVGRQHKGNLGIGIERSVWGWRSSALDLRDGDARRVARSMRAGDHLVLGWWGPSPRERGTYLAGKMRRLVITRIVKTLYEDQERIWPDDVFPERVGLCVLDVIDNVPGHLVGEPGMMALNYSANTKGVPVAGSPVPVAALTHGGGDAATPAADEKTADLDEESDEGLDAYALVARRKEQRRLRRLKLGEREVVRCQLCGRDMPRHLVVLAHIKRRADSSYRERLDLSNVMAACVLGCDALFEHGHVHVDADGLIRPGRAAGPDVADLIKELGGRKCPAFDSASAPYFAAHAARSLLAPARDSGFGLDVDYRHGAQDRQVSVQPGQHSERV